MFIFLTNNERKLVNLLAGCYYHHFWRVRVNSRGGSPKLNAPNRTVY